MMDLLIIVEGACFTEMKYNREIDCGDVRSKQ
jgi:hypothetical protein